LIFVCNVCNEVKIQHEYIDENIAGKTMDNDSPGNNVRFRSSGRIGSIDLCE
jgi:hypothetical protein